MLQNLVSECATLPIEGHFSNVTDRTSNFSTFFLLIHKKKIAYKVHFIEIPPKNLSECNI